MYTFQVGLNKSIYLDSIKLIKTFTFEYVGVKFKLYIFKFYTILNANLINTCTSNDAYSFNVHVFLITTFAFYMFYY